MAIVYRDRSTLPHNSILYAPEQTFICTTNCEGAMGRGIALDVKLAYPDIYKYYRKLHFKGGLTPNLMISCPIENGRRCLLFPTKVKWRAKAKVDLILENLDKLGEMYEKYRITSLAIPPLGMENGWLNAAERTIVMDRIESTFSSIDIDCTFYRNDL